MRAQHALALEADLLGDALGRDVVRIGDEIDALQLELVERVTREEPKRARADAPVRAPRRRSSSRYVRGSRCELRPMPDAADDDAVDARWPELRWSGDDLAADERAARPPPCTGAGSAGSSARPRGRCSRRRSRRRRPRSTAAARDRRRGAPREQSTNGLGESSQCRGHAAAKADALGQGRLCAVRKPALAGFPTCGRIRRRPTLPGACAPSTIGAGGLNFSVRNGKRCIPAAMTAQIVEVAGRELR